MEIKGTINFRPVGHLQNGSPKNIYLYRSGNLSHLDNSVVPDFKKLGIECNIDLRSSDEISRLGKPEILISSGVIWKHFPLKSDDTNFRNVKIPTPYDYYCYYLTLFEGNSVNLANVIQFIACSSYKKFVINCYAGKDRTGILVALLMHALGLPAEKIFRDYEHSEIYLLKNIDFFESNWTKRSISRDEYSIRLRPNRQSLIFLFEKIKNQHGSVLNYLKNIGVKEASLIALNRKFRSQFFI